MQRKILFAYYTSPLQQSIESLFDTICKSKTTPLESMSIFHINMESVHSKRERGAEEMRIRRKKISRSKPNKRDILRFHLLQKLRTGVIPPTRKQTNHSLTHTFSFNFSFPDPVRDFYLL